MCVLWVLCGRPKTTWLFPRRWLRHMQMFNYLKWRKLCDATFMVFTLFWILTRHVVFNIIVYR